ncbi:hypothetical protein [Nonomuraea diastatica]|uniref:Uncharacterized protein n=1 Tax=Nonomuraea diastatica TaxID=1848329 RepID=A0A4V6PD37_9ACTN|nr:hypothetical protein [Nonomuraea diastatica]TDD20707.1 hypothetical protein E1294_16790 [Nonomuraea diastatica]
MPDFDLKVTRNAVRRGVFRTAAIVLTVLVLLAAAVMWGSALVQTRGDREQRMVAVLGTAFKIYSPAYAVSVEACCETTPVSMSMEVNAAPLRPAGDFWPAGGAAYTISQDLFGRVGRLPLGSTANTRLSTALYDVGTTLAPKEEVRRVLDRLPGDLRALAVVEFATPLTESAMNAFVKRHGTCADRVAYERRPGALPITWGFDYWGDPRRNPGSAGKKGGDMTEESCGGGLRDFRSWAGLLREHDDANLRAFDLSLDRLRRAADGGLAHAYVDQLSSIEKLRGILKDPHVRTVRLADVAFDLDKP